MNGALKYRSSSFSTLWHREYSYSCWSLLLY